MTVKDKFQGVDISPATLKDGSLLAAFDTITHPGTSGFGATVKTGTAKVGALGVPVLSAPTPATTGGTLAAGTRAYRVSAVGRSGEGVPCAARSATTTGSTGKVTLTFTSPAGETRGFKVYRDGLHLVDVAHGTLTYVDTGSVAPSGAIPTIFRGDKGSEENSGAPRPE